MNVSRPGRRSLVGLGVGVAGAGLAGGVAAHRHLPPASERQPGQLAPQVVTRRLIMDDGAALRLLDAQPSGGGGAGGGDAAGGCRPPVLLLHGITLGADIWHLQLDSLAAAGHRVLAYDLRGHGGSDSSNLTFARLASDLIEVLELLDLHDVIVVGHSMGGMVAIKALAGDDDLAKGQGRIAALVLAATSANPLSGAGIPGARFLARAMQPALSRSTWLASRLPGPTLPKLDAGYLLARVNFGVDPVPAEVALTQGLVTGVRARVTVQLLSEILRFDDLAALAHVHLPASVLVGTRDIVTPARHGRALAAAIGGAELVVLEGCGHMVMLERPAALADAILRLAQPA